MLAQRMPTVLPPLSALESIETTRIYSVLGQLPADQPLMARRPFRSPHHTISDAGLVGGGSQPVPGEISKSHNGVLFLDELPEFNRKTLEVMRQPLEDGIVTISRALQSTTFPADFMLVATANPCPCGYRSDPRRNCNCTPPQIEKYMSRISGPLLDRIDIHLEVPAVPFDELADNTSQGTSSDAMRQDVMRARDQQATRFHDQPTLYNSQMTSRQVRHTARLIAYAGRCCATASRNSDFQQEHMTKYFALQGQSQMWLTINRLVKCILPKPSATAVSIVTYGSENELNKFGMIGPPRW